MLEVTDDLGLRTLVKTSGGKGLHIVAPIQRHVSSEELRHAANRLTEIVLERRPDLVTAEFRKADRGGKVMLDPSRNSTGATVVAPYSPRARDEATVSFPVVPEELQTHGPVGVHHRNGAEAARSQGPTDLGCGGARAAAADPSSAPSIENSTRPISVGVLAARWEHAVMPTTAVRVTGLTKRFGEVQALAGIDFEIPEGTIFGLLGPNGAGKTTAVRILATVHRPDAGTAEVLGYDVVNDPHEVRMRIGLAGQYAAVDPNLTGRENLRLMGRLAQVERPTSRPGRRAARELRPGRRG